MPGEMTWKTGFLFCFYGTVSFCKHKTHLNLKAAIQYLHTYTCCSVETACQKMAAISRIWTAEDGGELMFIVYKIVDAWLSNSDDFNNMMHLTCQYVRTVRSVRS